MLDRPLVMLVSILRQHPLPADVFSVWIRSVPRCWRGPPDAALPTVVSMLREAAGLRPRLRAALYRLGGNRRGRDFSRCLPRSFWQRLWGLLWRF